MFENIEKARAEHNWSYGHIINEFKRSVPYMLTHTFWDLHKKYGDCDETLYKQLKIYLVDFVELRKKCDWLKVHNIGAPYDMMMGFFEHFEKACLEEKWSFEEWSERLRVLLPRRLFAVFLAQDSRDLKTVKEKLLAECPLIPYY